VSATATSTIFPVHIIDLLNTQLIFLPSPVIYLFAPGVEQN
jgi:hypothetical protein